jgi:hypothetical protein
MLSLRGLVDLAPIKSVSAGEGEKKFGHNFDRRKRQR